ncbi:MAG: lipid-A-disaccharide synthase N-terminal domain-containing protein [Verrucomicrobiota bacterium]
MNTLTIIAITWVGKEYRFFGLDWSYIMILGLIGNLIFSMRFIVQWFASERKGESVIPVSFWYWSIGGSIMMCFYFIFRRDPVGILAYLPNSAIYVRNLMLIRKRKFAYTAAAPSQHPHEVGECPHCRQKL